MSPSFAFRFQKLCLAICAVNLFALQAGNHFFICCLDALLSSCRHLHWQVSLSKPLATPFPEQTIQPISHIPNPIILLVFKLLSACAAASQDGLLHLRSSYDPCRISTAPCRRLRNSFPRDPGSPTCVVAITSKQFRLTCQTFAFA